MFRTIRVVILLLVLAGVAMSSWMAQQRSTDWTSPLYVVVYPINGDDSVLAAEYISRLTRETFTPMEDYLAEQAAAYGVELLRPVEVDLATEVASRPPTPPVGGNWLQVAFWSLKLRYWAWRHSSYEGPPPHVKLYVQYFDPSTHKTLAHSLGLRNSMIGIINAFATRRMEGSNQVVMTHELLHTLGASDKYDLATNQPIYPIGYAEPGERRYPQSKAELMGGRIPVSETEAKIPASLRETLIGPATAREIKWITSGTRDG